MSLKIVGFGKGVPALAVHNDRLSELVETSDEWISSRAGIRERRISQGESLTQLAAQAGREAMERGGVRAEELDYIICTTIQGDYVTPSLACLVERELGASCPSFDINAACTGFLFGLDTAAALMDSGRAETILLISAEMMSKHLDWSDRATCVLFGDGAGAVVLRKGDGLKAMELSSEGDEAPLNIPADFSSPFYPNEPRPAYLEMKGSDVFKFAVHHMTEESERAMAQAGVTVEQIKWFVPHQANMRIIRASTKKLGFREEQTAINIDRYGNTSSATIPILLAELFEQGKLAKGDYLLLAAMGGGLTSGACVIQL